MVNSYKISDNKIMTPALLAEYIGYHDRQVRERYAKLGKAYEAKYDIRKRSPKERWKPDNRLRVGFPRYLTDTFTGFFCGISPKIEATDERANEALQGILTYTDFTDQISELAKQSSIYGKAYVMAFVDRYGEIGTAITNPLSSFIIEDEGIVPDPVYFVHTYIDSNNVRRGSFSDGSYIQYFEINPDLRFLGDPVPHGFDGVPAVCFSDNAESIGLFEQQMDIIVGYAKGLSYELDDIEGFASAILKILGAKLTQDEMAALRENMIINFEGSFNGSDLVVDFLHKPDGNQTQENFMNRVENLIFTLSMVENLSDDKLGASSGIALKYRLLSMYNLAAVKERKFKIALKKLFRIICSNPVCALREDDFRLLRITFYRNLPANLVEETQIAGQLAGITSRETQLGVLSIVPDVAEEKEKIKEEEEEALAMGYPTDRIAEENE